MARGRPAKGITKKQTEEPAVMEEPQQQSGSRYSMRTRPQSKPVGDTNENAKTEQKKKTPGRKRKAAPAEEEETTVVKEAEPAKVEEKVEPKAEEETTKQEEKEEGKEEEEKNDEATESSKASQEGEIKVNRAPVLTMWVAAVAERQGFTFDEAVTFGKAISGLFAHSKGKKIGVIESDAAAESPEKKKAKKVAEKFDVFGNSVYGKTTDKGRFALESGKAIAPNSVKAYLHRAFKDDYDRVREAFEALANSLQPEEIGSRAYHLYEKFRPEVPEGAKGWGARGLLDLKHVQELAASG